MEAQQSQRPSAFVVAQVCPLSLVLAGLPLDGRVVSFAGHQLTRAEKSEQYRNLGNNFYQFDLYIFLLPNL